MGGGTLQSGVNKLAQRGEDGHFIICSKRVPEPKVAQPPTFLHISFLSGLPFINS